MPRYNYICKDCEEKALEKFGPEITQEQFEEFVLFETAHSMEPSEAELAEAKICPRCDGANCEITVLGTDIHSYIRGYGWMDKDGIKRDMNRYQLANKDPYAQYRMPGEADDIMKKLERPASRSNPKHFVQNNDKAIEKAVEKVVRNPKN